ncbi:sensor domain-containing diguanylate cyclase [bacterium]|nr:MAG: sensor domain-containing diguanylate cyclase [bacterium]
MPYLAASFCVKIFAVIFLFFLSLIIYCIRKDLQKKYNLKFQMQHLQEGINIINDKMSAEIKNKLSLQDKTKRYASLKEIIEEINQNLERDSITETLVSVAFNLISAGKGSCLLYIVDHQTQKLNLYKTKKEDRRLVIKAKEGDVFDLWVLRHGSPLFIEDLSNDFRFDHEKIKLQEARPIASLISAPFVSENRFLGILRLDSEQPNFYSQDDLRLLATICDLGAVAIENSEYFEKAQDLAIHDGLTAFYRKGYFLERIKEECRRSTKHNKDCSLLMIDIDYFKKYNDKFGHTAGDIVLKSLSQNIAGYLKDKNSIVSRFGGEEFCVILPDMEKKKALNLAEELRDRIQKNKIVLRRQETNITVSIGVATCPEDAKDETGLIFKADKAMYEAKQKGRNRVASA